MTAPLVAPSYIASLIAAGKITVNAPTGVTGRPPNPVRTVRLDKERERQRLKRVAFIAQGLTCHGTERKRKVYEPRVTLTPKQLAEVKWMDMAKHMMKALGRDAMLAKATWHEQLADRLKRVLAGECNGKVKGLTEDGKKEARRESVELYRLEREGRRVMARRAKWHLELARKLRLVTELGRKSQ